MAVAAVMMRAGRGRTRGDDHGTVVPNFAQRTAESTLDPLVRAGEGDVVDATCLNDVAGNAKRMHPGPVTPQRMPIGGVGIRHWRGPGT